jgi:hypothetical protein
MKDGMGMMQEQVTGVGKTVDKERERERASKQASKQASERERERARTHTHARERERCKQKGGRAKRNGRMKKRVILMGTREIHLQT